MSGEKQARIRNTQLQRMARQMRMEQNQQDRAQRLEQELAAARRTAEQAQRASRDRQRAFDQTVASLSKQVQQSTREFDQRLKQEQERHAQAAAKHRAELAAQRSETRDLAQQQARQARELQNMDQRMHAQRTEYLQLVSRQADQLRQVTDGLARKEADAQAAATLWLTDAEKILEHIQQQHRHALFRPGDLDRLQGEWRQSQANIQAGHFQAAIATGQALYRKALTLQAELEWLEQEWNAYYAEAQESVRRLLAECESNQTATFVFQGDGADKTMDAEIDYWTDGQLSALKIEAAGLSEELDATRDQLRLDRIKEVIEQSQTLQHRLLEVCDQARHVLAASQLRHNLADDVVEELAKRGWHVEDDAWEGEDADGRGWKNSLHVKLKNAANDEIITVVIPEHGPEGPANRIQFAFYPKDNNDAVFAGQQTRELEGVLQHGDSGATALRCVPGFEQKASGSPERRDFQAVRQGKAKTDA
jgi:hypothetical protein